MPKSLYTVLPIAMLLSAMASAPAVSQEQVLNLYSARHYQTDEQLYADFTRQTGVRINRIEADDNALYERLRNEGRNSPADAILMVDAARLWRAQAEGMFQPVQSPVLNARIPANLRGGDEGQGPQWFGFSTRARVIVYNKVKLKADDVRTYAALADPKLKGMVCTRSGSHPYMLSLVGALIEHRGEAETEQWARGIVANFARGPQGGDTDQIKAVASGECGVALTNTYYYARLMRSNRPEDRDVVNRVGFVWPDQDGAGTHINVAGGAVARNAPNRAAAVRFLEYLASDEAQVHFANGNNEWPAVPSVSPSNPALRNMGKFKADNVSISAIGRNQVPAQRILDRAGYK